MRGLPPPAWPVGRRTALAGLLYLLVGLPGSAAAVEPRGRPTVTLDRLVFAVDVPNAKQLERHLRTVLGREARRAQWGAGRGSKIEYRFVIEQLSISVEGSVLRIRCTALGRLPKGKSARSRLEYGGSPARRHEELKKVLEIVARGVITRLAELERHRRQ